MIILVIIIVIILIFPIFIDLKITNLSGIDKIYFKFSLFSFVKVLYGEVNINKLGFVINLYNKKKIVYPFKKLLNLRENIKPLRDYHLLRFNVLLKLSTSDNLDHALIIASFFQTINQILANSIRQLKPYVKFNNYIDLYENLNEKKLFISFKFVFNLLTVLLSFIKKLLGKIYIWKKKITD